MNEDLIKPDTNKPVVPDMDSDTPSITSETEDIPASKSPTADVETPQPTTPEEPPKFSTPSPSAQPPAPAEPLSPATPQPPAMPQPASPVDVPAPQPHKKPWLRLVLIAVVALLVVVGIVYAAFAVGFSRGHTAGRNDQVAASEAIAIKVPEHATMVAQCTAGAGTQYVMPSDIPQGPIYNVWNNKVTGIEFMLAQSKIAANKTLDIALNSQKYDHIDVMYEAAGHAGFTEPHYHIVLSMISYKEEQKITCDSNSSSSPTHESHDMSSMDM